ncbi:hypothetical protein DOE78_23160 [Bacillus sp. Y1]|nr:hypothetical protein DOE78_23160 [Bacillus sp. Y1]
MNWIIRHGTLMFIVAIASLIWCMNVLPGDYISLALSWGLTYLVWTAQCIVYVILGILKIN